MAGGNSTYRLNFKVGADTSEAITQINKLNQTLNNIQSKPVSIFNPNEMSKAVSAAEDIQKALQNAIDPRTGAFDLSRFSLSLQDSKKSLSALRTELMSAGEEGQQAFLQLSTTIANAGLPTSRLLGLFKKLGNTVINTINWNITNGALRAITGTIKSAMGYAEDLNKSLNKIRIVTGKSADDMARFAKTATEAAQALSTTTKEYADASLIYYQQGLSDEEVKTRTDVTVKMANVTGESARQVSEHLTAVWNNFYDGSKSLEYYADVMTKLGATTASSTTEISEGLEKFAAIADTVGLSYEYAASALATVTATTRQSADIVGTAFKTLFARMESLKLGETLDDGTSLKQYSQALATVGVNIKDATGNLRDMDDILDDLGAKWSMISKDQQVALAQQIAGVRQYTQLMALMNNWDFMQQNLATANSSIGTLAEQQAIYEQSWEASSERVRAAWEDVYNFIANDDFFIGLNDLLSGTLIPSIEGLIKGLGGIKGLLFTIFGNILSRASKEVPGFLYATRREVEILVGLGNKRAQLLQQENARVSRNAANDAFNAGRYEQAGLLRGNAGLSRVKGMSGLSRDEMANATHRASVARTVAGKLGAMLDKKDIAQEAQSLQIERTKQKILEQQLATYQKIAAKSETQLATNKEKLLAARQNLSTLEQEKAELDVNSKTYDQDVAKIDNKINKEKQIIEKLTEQNNKLTEQITKYNSIAGLQQQATKSKNVVYNAINTNQNRNLLNANANDLYTFSRFQGSIGALEKFNQFKGMTSSQKNGVIGDTRTLWEDIKNSNLTLSKQTIKAVEKRFSELDEMKLDGSQDAELTQKYKEIIKFLMNSVMKAVTHGIEQAEEGVDAASEGVNGELVAGLKANIKAAGVAEGEDLGEKTAMQDDILADEEPIVHSQTMIEKFSKMAGAAMQVAGAFHAISNTLEVMTDDTAGASEKISALTSAGMSTTMAINSLSGALEDMGIASHTAMAVGIMGLIGALSLITTIIEKEKQATINYAKETKETAFSLKEENDEVRNLTNSFHDLLEQQRQGADVSNNLKESALELAKSLGDEQAITAALIGDYTLLNKLIKDYNDEQARKEEIAMTTAAGAANEAIATQINDSGKLNVIRNGDQFDFTASLGFSDVKIDDILAESDLLEKTDTGWTIKAYGDSVARAAEAGVDIYDQLLEFLDEKSTDVDKDTQELLQNFRTQVVNTFSTNAGDSTLLQEVANAQEINSNRLNAHLAQSSTQDEIKQKNLTELQEYTAELAEKYGVAADAVYNAMAETLPENKDIILAAKNSDTYGFDVTKLGDAAGYADMEFLQTTGGDNSPYMAHERQRAENQQRRLNIQEQQEIVNRGQSLVGEDLSKQKDWYQDNKEFMMANNVKNLEEFLTMTDDQKNALFNDLSETLRMAAEDATTTYLADLDQRIQELQQYSDSIDISTEEGQEAREEAEKQLGSLIALKEEAIDSAYVEHLQNEEAEVKRVADAYGVNSDEIKKHTQYLANNADKLEEVDDELQGNYEASQKIAIAQARLNKGVKDLNSNWEDSYATLKQTNKSSLQYSQALQTIQEDLANVFNIDQAEVFSEEFITQHRGLIEQVAQGDMEAAATLSQYVAQMLFDLSSATMEAEGINTTAISNMIADWQYLDTLPVGYNLTAQYADVCTALLTATASTREQIENMLTSLSIAYDYQYDSNGNPIGVTLRSTGPRAYSAPKITPKGGGGGGKKSKPAKTKYSETDFERYKEITDKIDDVNRELKEMETIADRLYGASQLAAMEEENRILSEQAENYRKKRIEAEEYLNLDKERMLAYGKANGLDIKVENNRVVNYRELMEGLQAKKDAQMVKYNALGTEEAQSEYWETYIQPIVDKMDGLQTVIDQFDETYDVMRDMEEQERETVRKIQDNNYNMIQGKYTMNVKLIDNDKKFLETMKNLISDDIYGVAEKLLLTWNPDDSMNLAERSMAQMNDLATKKAELEAGYALWQEDNLAEGAISRDKFQEGMQEIFEDSLGLIENLHEIDEYFRTIERDTLEKFNDEWDYYLSLQERNTEFIEYVGKLIPLIYGKNNYKAMKQWFETQTEQAERLYETAQKKHAIAVQNLENIQKMYNEATAEEQKWLEDTLRAAQEEANQTAQEMEEAHLNALEKKSDEIQNNINAAWQNFEEQVTNGLGFDFLKTSFGNLASIEDLLYTKTEQVYEVNKFLHELSKDMDKTDSIAAKNKIAAFAKETAAMKEQGELSKFELEVQKAKYNILLAQLALEDAANAKSIVRLHRDDEGNYGYIYSADPSKLDDAQQNLEDKQHDLYELVKNGTNRLAQALINEEQNFMQEVQKLQDIYGKDTAEYFEKLAILTDEHNHKMEILEGDYQLAVTELDQAGIDGRKEAVMLAHEDAVNASLDWRETETNTIEEVNTNLGILTDYMNTSVTEAIGTVGRALDETNTEAEELANYMTGEFANKMQENIDQVGDIVDAYEDWRKKLEEVEQQAKNAAKAAKEALEEVTKANNYQAPKVNRQTNDTAPGTVTTTGLGGGNGGEDGGNNGGYPGTVTDPDAWKSVILTSTMAEKFAINKLHMKDGQQVFYNFLNNWANKKTKGQLAQKYSTHEAFIKSLNTGGYTGNWSDPSLGKLAILHEKELVLNKDDTENMLAAVNIIRKVTSAIDMNTLSTLASLGTLGVPSYTASDQVLEQTVTITAEFPNATNHSEIEQAFNNLINRASQYAARR